MTEFAPRERLDAASQANIDTLVSLANSALGSAERIAALNLSTARSVLEDGVANAQALLSAKDAEELFSVQSAFAQPMIDKLAAYARGVYEIAAEGRSELSGLFEARIAEVNAAVASALDEAAGAAPAGSEPAFAAARSALAAASSAYQGVSQAARQAAEIAEANAAAATKTRSARNRKGV